MVLEISTFGTIFFTMIITIVCVILLFFVVLFYYINKDSKEDSKHNKEEDEKDYQAITHVHAFNSNVFNSDNIIDMNYDVLLAEFNSTKKQRII